MNLKTVIAASRLTKTYKRGREEVRALDNVSFEITEGEFTAIVGPSGAGKSTLLNLLGCMDAPTSGTLQIDGSNVDQLDDTHRTRLRREKIGFVFQHFGLLPALTVAENVALPGLFARQSVKMKIPGLLEQVGLARRYNHRPHELSGGEMQRVAIARALINGPRLLLADEPTGNLDTATGASIISLFQELNRISGLTIVVVTHNSEMAGATRRQIAVADGCIVGDSKAMKPAGDTALS